MHMRSVRGGGAPARPAPATFARAFSRSASVGAPTGRRPSLISPPSTDQLAPPFPPLVRPFIHRTIKHKFDHLVCFVPGMLALGAHSGAVQVRTQPQGCRCLRLQSQRRRQYSPLAICPFTTRTHPGLSHACSIGMRSCSVPAMRATLTRCACCACGECRARRRSGTCSWRGSSPTPAGRCTTACPVVGGGACRACSSLAGVLPPPVQVS